MRPAAAPQDTAPGRLGRFTRLARLPRPLRRAALMVLGLTGA